MGKLGGVVKEEMSTKNQWFMAHLLGLYVLKLPWKLEELSLHKRLHSRVLKSEHTRMNSFRVF